MSGSHRRWLRSWGFNYLSTTSPRSTSTFLSASNAAEGSRLVGRPDILVGGRGGPSGMELLEAPVQIVLPDVDFGWLSYIEIRDRRRRELITVIELLSPSNKLRGPDREQYLSERGRFLTSEAHLVEIDLLRIGEPMTAEDQPNCDYSVMVSLADQRPRAGFCLIHLRDRLPVVPIPVRAPDSPAYVDLQAVLHRIYDAARYDSSIHEGTPEPPLSPEDAAWARGFLATTARDPF